MQDSSTTAIKHREDQRAPGQVRQGIDRYIEGYWAYLRLIADRKLTTPLRQKIGASDVVQETLLAAHQDRHRFRGQTEGELKRWLVRILSCNILDAEKAHRRRCRDVNREIAIDEQPAQVALIDPDLTPRRGAMHREEHTGIMSALSRLPGHYREVVLLRAVEGCTFAEIAQRTKRTSESARHIWSRAIRQLAHTLARDDQSDSESS